MRKLVVAGRLTLQIANRDRCRPRRLQSPIVDLISRLLLVIRDAFGPGPEYAAMALVAVAALAVVWAAWRMVERASGKTERGEDATPDG
jgi:hypothetical protein